MYSQFYTFKRFVSVLQTRFLVDIFLPALATCFTDVECEINRLLVARIIHL